MSKLIFEDYKQDSHSVWSHYLREKNGQIAKCKKCAKQLKCAGGSTGALHTHLKKLHDIHVLKRKDEPPVCEATPPKITTFFKPELDDSLPAVLSRMVALDGLTFSVFCTSADLRKCMIAKGFEVIPKSPNSIKKLVMQYAEKIKTTVASEFVDLKKQGLRASLSFDEWTSVNNHRYININVHFQNKTSSLGLSRINGSLGAEECMEMVRKKLKEFQLCLDNDIVCITMDGASVMKKVGRLIKADQQLCLAHAVQLAVVNVLYKNKAFDDDYADDTNDDDENEATNDDDENEATNDDDDDGGLQIDINESCDVDVRHAAILPLIKKIRLIVRMFRKSPTKNDLLQKYVKAKFNKELTLILDTKTRWNRLLFMLERFNQIHSCIQNALIDLSSDIQLSANELLLLQEIISVLNPIKLSVEALCRSDANLLTADATLNFVLSNLEVLNTKFSNELKDALEYQIKQRRTDCAAVLQFLHNGYQSQDERSMEVFKKLEKPAICRFICRIIKRLAKSHITPPVPQISDINNENEDCVEVPSNDVNKWLQHAIEKAMKECASTNPTANINNLQGQIKRDVTILENGGIRSKLLDECYKMLLSIPPTSVEAERAFLSSGYIVTKIRCRLQDVIIDNLCFLRSFFQKNIKQN